MRETIVISCALTLLGAALLEMLCIHRGKTNTGVSSSLMAAACTWLAARIFYLFAMDDTARLSWYGTVPIILMAWARVIACSVLIWRKP